jgi:hypothetical protein|tara:strand:- start:249 stop:689 length:441 start_codon:yes stop_codon:yes gene_type:complete
VAKSKFATLWTPIMSRRVEALFDQGGAVVEAARLIGIDRSTFHRWEKTTDKEKSGFREIARVGREAAEAWWLRQGRENLENRAFNYGGWMMNMQNRYGYFTSHGKKEEKKEIEHTGTVEVKKKVDVDTILKKALNKGIEELEKSIH